MQRLVALVRRMWNAGMAGKLAVMWMPFLILLCVALPFMPKRPQNTTTAGIIATQGPTLIPEDTNTPEPTLTPTISPTPEPTSTPSPTSTPVPPTATPEPILIEGNGQTVTDPFTLSPGINRVLFAHDGTSNFIVKLFDEDGNDNLLVNKIGRYAGFRPIPGGSGMFLEIKADGGWMAMIEPLKNEPDAVNGIDGEGDWVSGFFTPSKLGPVPYNFNHTGKSNFIVHLYCTGGHSLVQNHIGVVSGSSVVRFEKGPCFWEVQADGAWDIKPK